MFTSATRGFGQILQFEGQLTHTPTQTLDLRPGDRVRIKSKDEILATLNKRNRNRGLSFDVEMAPHCGREATVLKRVDKVIEEKTGRLVRFTNACVILEGVTCSGRLSHWRLFCPRCLYPFWREIWLERIE
jgi:hypothetical protein